MTQRLETTNGRPFRAYLRTAAKLVLAVIGLAVLTHLSWNLFAPDLFDLPQIRMKQALGLTAFLAMLSLFLRFALDGRRHE